MEDLNKLLDHLDKGYRKIEELGKQNHLVLTLGVTGSGKSTFILYVAGYDDQLSSKELLADSGDFVIEDDEGRISDAESTLCSQTFIPEIIKDRDSSSNLVYCDCPGFEDTRSPVVDMANAYFIQKVIASSVAVKMVFVISYSSLRVGVNRTDLKTLVEHATSVVRNIDNLKDSICLAVTKVDNTYLKDGTLVPDETIVKSIAAFIEKAIKSAQQMGDQWSPDFLFKFKQFLSIFLSTDHQGNYNKICIFRRPDAPGRVKDIASMAQRKLAIKKALSENILFRNYLPSDFGLSIKHESQTELYSFLELIQGKLLSHLKDINDALQLELQNFILKCFNIPEIIDYIDSCRKVFKRITKECDNAMNPRTFIRKLENSFQQLDIPKNPDLWTNLHKLVDFFDTLTPLSKKNVTYRTVEWSKALQDILEDYRNSRGLYRFFKSLWTNLLEYPIQTDIKTLNESQVEDIYSNTFPFGTTVLRYFKNFGISLDATHEGSNKALNSCDAEVLSEILKLTLRNETNVTRENGWITATGAVVMLSDISQHITKKTKGISIFANNKVFFDDDLDLKGCGAEVFIISPIWEVIGSRKIVLDGHKGKPRSKGDDGEDSGDYGVHGKPGRPGQCGGHFYGIVDQLIQGDSLCISSNGGDGGKGQDGGDGATGKEGRRGQSSSSSEHVSRDVFDLLVYSSSTDRCAYKGEKGGRGGNGGDGGVGGLGGLPGKIIIKKIDPGVNVKVEASMGKTGIGGKGGKGGPGGKDGDDLRGSRTTYHIFKFEIKSESGRDEYRDSRSYGEPGDNGENDSNECGIQEPEPVPQSCKSEIISQYLDFHNESEVLRIEQCEVERFINFVNECDKHDVPI